MWILNTLFIRLEALLGISGMFGGNNEDENTVNNNEEKKEGKSASEKEPEAKKTE